MNLEDLDRATLEALRCDPMIGDQLRKRVTAALQDRATAPPSPAKAPGSTAVGVMNKTEAEWSRRLDVDPGVIKWRYEEVKLRVGVERAWLTPDFLVFYADGSIGFDEIKGAHVRDDARAKFQAAARLHPWARWRYVQKKGGAWRVVHDYPPEEN